MSKYNILIIEDHALTRFGLITAFETEKNFAKIFEAANAKSGIKIMAENPVDIVIMDLGLPDINGIEATKKIKEKHSNAKIVILSSHEQEEDVIKSIKAGACAYCTKDVAPQKLVDIVNSALKGASWFDPKVAGYVLNAAVTNNVKQENQNVEAKPSLNANLTTRETEVLALLAEGLTNVEIAKKLNISVNTTKVHVCSILHKLEVNDRTQAAIKAIKHNII